MIKISERLESLVKYVNRLDSVMDVGCDHALLDIYIIESGILDHIYIGDVNPKALENGKTNVEKYGLQDQITPILSYGIEKIRETDVNTLIISGMGSKTIIDILSSPNLTRIYKLILQSNNNHRDLREFLTKQGFEIIDEEVIKDGKKTYINIIASRTSRRVFYEEKEYEFGPILIKDKNNLEYFKALYDNMIDIVSLSKSDEMREKIHLLESVIEDLSE